MTILFVLTSHGEMGATGRETGLYLLELAHPYEQFMRAGYQMARVSPKVGEPPTDAVDAADPV